MTWWQWYLVMAVVFGLAQLLKDIGKGTLHKGHGKRHLSTWEGVVANLMTGVWWPVIIASRIIR